MKTQFLLLLFLLYSIAVNAQADTTQKKITHTDSAAQPQPFQYDKDAGLQYKNGDFTWTTWAFAERLFSPDNYPAWRRVRQGMEFKFPAYNFLINGNKFRTALVYEVDFTDNNFFKDSKRFKIWENLFVTFQNAEDPNRFRILFGENTSILSREDNLSSGNLPTINRSLILEQHGSTNSFGTQWGFQLQKQISTKTFLQASLQDNRGSLNQDKPMFQFWKGTALKVTQTILQPGDSSSQKLNVGLAVDYTRDIPDKQFTLASGIHQQSLGSTPASGNKLTFENNMDYTNTLGTHLYSLEYEVIFSSYSVQKLNVAGGYAQLQYQLFDGNKIGDLVPFVRYDIVNLSNALHGKANEKAIKIGLNYNLPFTHKLINFHVEYAQHYVKGSSNILSLPHNKFNEFRLELRVNATRYLRF
ncbi:MAG: hypothetical protein M3004_13655 [Bacteroidota bacterium]|nr:hypothetical protein [Bacteroidota bacterium]